MFNRAPSFIRLSAAAIFLAPAVSASDFALNGPLPELSAPGLAAPDVKPPALKEWTFMVFVNGKNDLESSTLVDVNQMELAGTTDKVNIVVELGRARVAEGDDTGEGDWTGVRRYLIVKDDDLKHIASPVLDERDADMGSWKELSDFVKWAKAAYPARRYALVIWDHGNGWKPIDPANAPDFANISKGISLDEATGHEISTLQLGAAFKAFGGVDMFMADVCNMQMASVAYELRNYAGVMVASEESEPGYLLRYAELLRRLNERPGSAPEELAVNAVRIYRDYFTGGGSNEGISVTQSAVRLGKFPELRARLDGWARLAMTAGEKDVLTAAKRDCQYYGDPEYKDLPHFVSLVTAGTRNAALRASGSALLKFIEKEVVLENWAQDKNSRGLSIYVPDAYDPLYDKLAWARDGLWDDFAKMMATLPPSAQAGPRAPRR